MPDPLDKRFAGTTALGRYGSVGIELVLSIGVGWWGGHWLDARIGGGHGWLTATGFVLGAVAGFRQLFVLAQRMAREAEAEAERDRQAGVVLPTFLKEHDDDPRERDRNDL